MKSIICEASSVAKAVEQGWQKAGAPQNFSVKVLEKEEKNFLGMTKKPAKVAIFFEEKFESQKKKPDFRDSRGNRDTRESRDTRDNRDTRDKKYSEPEKSRAGQYEKDKSLHENLKNLQESSRNITPKSQVQVKSQAQALKSQTQAQVKTPAQTQLRQFEKTQAPAQTSGTSTTARPTNTLRQTPATTKTQAQVAQAKGQPNFDKTQASNFDTSFDPGFSNTQASGQEKIRKSPWTDEMISEASKWVEGMLVKMNLQNVKFTVNVSSNNIKFHFEKCLVENRGEQKELFRNFAFLLMQMLRYKFKKQFKNLKAVFTCNI